MNLEVYNTENCKFVYAQNPFITIRRKGIIGLSGRFSLLTGIQAGETVSFYREKSTHEWYLSMDPKGFELKSYSNKMLSIHNKYLCNKIMNDLKVPAHVEYCKMMVSPEPVNTDTKVYFPLITKSVQYIDPKK